MIFGFTNWSPYSERIVIDKTSQTIKMEKLYLIREETLDFDFTEISYIKYERGRKTWETGSPPYWKVIAVIQDGREVELSSNGPNRQYDLARKIADATGKQIVETVEK